MITCHMTNVSAVNIVVEYTPIIMVAVMVVVQVEGGEFVIIWGHIYTVDISIIQEYYYYTHF